MTTSGKTYRRYTNLAAAIHMLQTKKLTLLTPDKWDDGNDRHFMKTYQDGRALKTLLAVCLAADSDTYGHWRVFSPNADGVCVVLRKDLLLASFHGIGGVKMKDVEYKEVARVESSPLNVEALPFTKRWPYRAEGEYRILYESRDEVLEAKDFAIPAECITKVVLSPWMPEPLVRSVSETLRLIEGFSKLKIYQSTLIKNGRWAAVADKATD
jgi:hypothetical protein